MNNNRKKRIRVKNGKTENYYVIFAENIKIHLNFKITHTMHIETIKTKDVVSANRNRIKKLEVIILKKLNYIKYYKNVGLVLEIEQLIKEFRLL